MTLFENDELVSDDKAVAEIFNDYFANITNSLGIEHPPVTTPLDIESRAGKLCNYTFLAGIENIVTGK